MSTFLHRDLHAAPIGGIRDPRKMANCVESMYCIGTKGSRFYAFLYQIGVCSRLTVCSQQSVEMRLFICLPPV